MTIHQTASALAAGSADQARAELVPSFDLLYGTMVELIETSMGDAPQILDLGSGLGLLSRMVGERRPAAQITLLDPSAELLAQGSTALAEQGVAHRSVTAGLDDLPDGPFDAVMSGLALHRLLDEDKQAVFARVHELLAPDGLFVAAEHVAGPSLHLDDLYHQLWLQELREGGVPAEMVEAAVGDMVYDHPATVTEQQAWMASAGFRDVDCFVKQYRFAVIGGWSSSRPPV